MTYYSGLSVAARPEINRQSRPLFRASWLSIAISLSLFGCATQLASEQQGTTKQPRPSPYKIAIINASNQPINTIKFKPCRSNSIKYRQLTGNLRPMEKFTVNIYSQCVDLLATNAFKKKLANIKNVDLSAVKSWTIK